MSESYATVRVTEEENAQGRMQGCVFAECSESGDESGPVWGTGEGSVRKALAELTEVCGCGASFHMEEEREGER
jgi:hypothetical protein